MCLELKRYVIRKARRDITCYKICKLKGSNVIVSLLQNYHYNIGKEETACNFLVEDILFSKSIYTKNVGFHSYKDKYCLMKYFNKHIYYHYRWYVNDADSTKCIVKCIIPKGSLYFKGKEGERRGYCSEKIIPIKITKIWK